MFTLTVKNFGVLKDINIEINKTNLFIGENGSGKSVLAKLITIVTDGLSNEKEILKRFTTYEIEFMNKDTLIEYSENNNLLLKINNNKVFLSDISKGIVDAHNEFSLIKNDYEELMDKINGLDIDSEKIAKKNHKKIGKKIIKIVLVVYIC